MEYVKYVQTKFNKTPKVVRSDRGGEYTGHDLTRFFRSEGIQVEHSVPYTPQQNGIAERKNRYLVEMTRSMLFDSKLPNKYWGEAVMTANHLQNMLPAAGDDKTPYEKWTGRMPDPSYLRRFGCLAYVAVPTEKRQKLDSKARKLIFVGYEEGTKGYRLLNTESDKIYISRDVIFLEGNCHADEIQNESSNRDTEVEVNIEAEPKNDDSHEAQVNAESADLRRSQRVNKGKAPERLVEIINSVNTVLPEPKTFTEALNSNEADQWKRAMDEEMSCLRKNETWTLSELPEGKSAIGCKWVYKTKTDEEGNVVRYKARLVAQGYSQKYGDDYDEVFAPVARPTTFRTMLTVAGHKGMIVKHYDIEAAYLNGELSHEVYMLQPDGYRDGDNLVCKLQKSLYGLKQGANEWNKKLHNVLSVNDFVRSENDPCLYAKQQDGQLMYVCVHVDDLVAAATSDSVIAVFERQMNEVLVMKNLGNLQYYLGLQLERDSDGIFQLHQRSYIEKKLREFQLNDCRPSNVPMDPGYQKRQEVHVNMANKEIYRRAIGSLQYLATNTRPDIAISTSILARRVSSPTDADWTEVKRIFRYLSHTKDMKLKLGDVNEQCNKQLIGFVDADWGGDSDDRKSNTGYLFKYLGAPISWSSKKQSLVTLSSTEAEYVALSEAGKEAL